MGKMSCGLNGGYINDARYGNANGAAVYGTLTTWCALQTEEGCADSTTCAHFASRATRNKHE